MHFVRPTKMNKLDPWNVVYFWLQKHSNLFLFDGHLHGVCFKHTNTLMTSADDVQTNGHYFFIA